MTWIGDFVEPFMIDWKHSICVTHETIWKYQNENENKNIKVFSNRKLFDA